VATAAQWVEGARLRTLPVVVAPVVAGSGAAAGLGGFIAWKAVLCLVVGLALQVGVNYANDYSDGIRGTDAVRVGPLRLVGSGAAEPSAVKRAAFGCFGLAALTGLLLALTSAWWLVLLGALAIAAAWFYTGGPHPYGYHGLGEVSVFCFFGLAATLGTTYVQAGTVGRNAVLAALACGFLACAVLVANNLRDLPSDAAVGKRTLSVRIGDAGSRRLFAVLVGLALLSPLAMTTWWALLGLLATPVVVAAARPVLRGAVGRELIATLRLTGQAELVFALALAAGLAVSR
jgi:1,4-dihydroxy-2-naphthoate octaprenyltransferase